MEEISRKIIIELKEGNQEAFKIVYKAYANQIFKISKYILKNDSWAEEIVQEAFLKLWLAKSNIDINQPLLAYVYVIAKRLCFNKLRSIKNDKKAIEELSSCIQVYRLEDEFQANEIKRILDCGVEKLTTQQKLVWKLSREEGYTHKQIAEQLDISLNTVKNHLVQALKSLRVDFGKTEYMPIKNKS